MEPSQTGKFQLDPVVTTGFILQNTSLLKRFDSQVFMKISQMQDQTAQPGEGNLRCPEFQLPSGAVFPDWSVVTSDNVRASLNDTLGKLRMARRWQGMSWEEDLLRQAILKSFTTNGKAPNANELADSAGLDPAMVFALLGSLCERDHILLDHTGLTVRGAYPFTSTVTEHRLLLGSKTLHAMCAIDALGAGAMLNRDLLIESSCRQCRRPVRIVTQHNGHAIKSATPENVIVWSGIQDIDACAADTQCTVMAFFCSDSHLAQWRDTNPVAGALGHRLTLDEGLQAGMAIFVPLLTAGLTTKF